MSNIMFITDLLCNLKTCIVREDLLMKKKFRYITYALAGLAIISALLITKDKLTAEAANNIYLNETNLTLELGRYRTLKVKGTNKMYLEIR